MPEELTVNLYTHESLFAMLVPMQTGVKWCNQVGGTSCCHPTVEGICVPLVGGPPEPDPLLDLCEDLGGNGEYWRIREDINKFLAADPALHTAFRSLTIEEMDALVEEDDFAFVAEAWVPVRVREDLPDTFYEDHILAFRGKTVILVYPNSD